LCAEVSCFKFSVQFIRIYVEVRQKVLDGNNMGDQNLPWDEKLGVNPLTLLKSLCECSDSDVVYRNYFVCTDYFNKVVKV